MPASFFAKTLRRSVLWLVLGVCPGVFVRWWVLFLGVVLVAFCLVLAAWCCVFYSCFCLIMLVVVWFVFGNVLVSVLGLSSRFVM